MNTRISFVRHAEVRNVNNIIYGRLIRFGLSERGWEQARIVAAFFRDQPLGAVFSSPMLRARQTARVIVQEHPHLRVQTSTLIHEVYGPFDGMPRDEAQARNWDLYTANDQQYEQPHDILRRVHRFITRVRRRYAGQHVVAVTHGDAIAFLRLWAAGLPISPQQRLTNYPAPTSVTTFTYQSTDTGEVPTYEYMRSVPVAL